MLEFLARNWGNLASVVGMIFSILAFWFSKRASEAARQARELVLTRTIGQDMNMGNRTASDIVNYVAMGREDMALLRVSELINHTSFMITRWRDRLPELSKNNLLVAWADLHSIHESLTRTSLANLNPKQKTQVAQSCQRVNEIFSGEYGAAIRSAEDREA